MFGALLLEAIFWGWFMAGGASKHGLGEELSIIISGNIIIKGKFWDFKELKKKKSVLINPQGFFFNFFVVVAVG